VLAFVNVINQVQNALGFFTASTIHSQTEPKRPQDGIIQIGWTEKASEVPRIVLI
jgi:hypothetical protein